MSEKKLGRRSVKTAEETKCHILAIAGNLFCELGYERVSLRYLSEQANVSHSLIRHHFGNKENIWCAVSDALHVFLSGYIKNLALDLPTEKPANIQIYHFSVRLLALLLIEPKPIQFVADTVRQEGKFVDYFLDKHGQEEEILRDLRAEYNQQNTDTPLDLWELRWQIANSAHGATALRPLLNLIWKEQASDPAQILHNHWLLFNKQMIASYSIPQHEALYPDRLDDLLLPFKCELKPNEI